MELFTNAENLESILIETQTEIEETNLKEFVFTSLSLNNITIESNRKVFAFYLEESKQYQIFISDKKYKYLIFEIFNNHKNSQEEFTLYLNKYFIVILKNSNFYYFQKFDYKIGSEDLVEYFYKKLNIKIGKINKIDCTKVEELKNEFIKTTSGSVYFNLNENRNYSFIFYCIFLISLICFLSFYFHNSAEELNRKVLKEKETIENKFLLAQEKMRYKSFYNYIEKLHFDMKKLKLKLEKLSYSKNELTIKFTSKSKENIYKFLSSLNKKVKTNTIEYLEKTKSYRCIINVQINRK